MNRPSSVVVVVVSERDDDATEDPRGSKEELRVESEPRDPTATAVPPTRKAAALSDILCESFLWAMMMLIEAQEIDRNVVPVSDGR